jgi:phosphatidylethanolamine-binding protein
VRIEKHLASQAAYEGSIPFARSIAANARPLPLDGAPGGNVVAKFVLAKLAFWSAAICASLIGAGATHAQSLTLSSPDIQEGAAIANEHVFKGFGCTGSNVSPALSWSGAPAGTKSFAVMMYDPDAPTGSGWWHWVAFNLPPTVTSLARGATQRRT